MDSIWVFSSIEKTLPFIALHFLGVKGLLHSWMLRALPSWLLVHEKLDWEHEYIWCRPLNDHSSVNIFRSAMMGRIWISQLAMKGFVSYYQLSFLPAILQESIFIMKNWNKLACTRRRKFEEKQKWEQRIDKEKMGESSTFKSKLNKGQINFGIYEY